MPPFYDQSNQRRLAGDYRGPVFIWDIDKTYLDTHFSSTRGLLRIPFELAVDKETIPGSVPLLRALRRGPGEQPALAPLYFISGSPPQLRRTIERRMTLDGVDFDGITFKDQLGLVRRLRLGDLKKQVGYKLAALLAYRRELPRAVRFHCFGDDVESDAEVFALFGEVCAGLRGDTLRSRLVERAVHADDIANIEGLSSDLPLETNPVEAIYIHLERRTPPERLATELVTPTRSYVQTALVLAQRRMVRPEVVGSVAKDLRLRGMGESTLREHLEDAQQRLHIDADLLALAAG